MADPAMQMILKQMQEDPTALRELVATIVSIVPVSSLYHHHPQALAESRDFCKDRKADELGASISSLAPSNFM